ncbi:hypothetical protein QE152_g5044 [Popillia japonica]|uniref:FP protein C-terminal domain-containing protein n=1 Tax=Popillia japonica TaxID=7064 RepID=A0AAW1MYN9_POPJA
MRIRDLEQYSRSNNLEIQGVPEPPNENIINVINSGAAFLKCPLSVNYIDAVHRVPTLTNRSNEVHKNIIVRFTSRRKRDELLCAARQYRRDLKHTGPGIAIPGISSLIFINEHLTKENKNLFKKARNAAKEKNYKYVWIIHSINVACQYHQLLNYVLHYIIKLVVHFRD